MNKKNLLSSFCRYIGILCLGTAVVTGCEPQVKITRAHHLDGPHKRALAENPLRVAVGMRPVGEQWICFRSWPDSGDEWLADPEKDPAAIKNVRRKPDGTLLEESDTYFSGQIYQPRDEGSPVPEAFHVWFSYDTKEFVVGYSGNSRKIERLVERAEEAYESTGKMSPLSLVAEVQKLWNAEKKPSQEPTNNNGDGKQSVEK